MSHSVFCNECGERLDNLPDLPSGERVPCSKCGSTVRDIHVAISETIRLQGHVAMIGRREDRAIGFRESAREGRVTSADRNDDGSFSYSILGSSPQGEEDSLAACRVLVSVLNAAGGNWTNPVPGEGVVDCEAVDSNLPGRKLSIQVTRAIADQSLWKQLNQRGSFEELNVSKEQFVAQMKNAIENKATERKIPRAVRQSLTLALDAIRLPVLGFEDIVEEFQSRFGKWTESLGFKAVWLVGPQDSLTCRLNGNK